MSEGLEEGLDETSLEARLRAPPPAPAGVPRAEKVDSAAKEVMSQGDQTLVDWFKTFSGSSLKIGLHRTAPETWEGRQVSGHLASFDELIDEDQVAERYGGGKFQVKAQKQLPNGRWAFAGAKTFKIAGDPKITGEHFPAKDKENGTLLPLTPVVNADADLSKVAMGTMERFAAEAVKRAERIEAEARGQSPFDPMILAIVTEPLKSQITTLNAQLAQKDALLIEKDRIIKDLSERRPDTTLQDRLLDKMYDGESAKLNGLRVQFESERRALVDAHTEEKKRMEHRSDVERQNLMEGHKRELRQLELSFDHNLKASELSYKGLLDAKENRIKDQERTIARQDSEINALRAKKDKSFQEQVQEMAQMKETFGALMGGSDEDEEKSTAERIMGMLAENPVVQGIGQRLAREDRPAQAAPPAGQQQQLAARKQRAREVLRPGQQAAPKPAPPPAMPAGMTEQGVQAAVQLMEGAVVNGTEPQVFAQSIRSMIPGSVVTYIQRHGIDSLLDGVARLTEESPLSTQVGRIFAREVAKSLIAPAP